MAWFSGGQPKRATYMDDFLDARDEVEARTVEEWEAHLAQLIDLKTHRALAFKRAQALRLTDPAAALRELKKVSLLGLTAQALEELRHEEAMDDSDALEQMTRIGQSSARQLTANAKLALAAAPRKAVAEPAGEGTPAAPPSPKPQGQGQPKRPAGNPPRPAAEDFDTDFAPAANGRGGY